MPKISSDVRELLCIAEPEKYSFFTSITGVHDENGRTLIKLAETYFHPTSGGEMGDTGAISISDGPKVRITELIETQDGVMHVTESSLSGFSPGMNVKADIDRERRLHNKTHHTAGHIIFSAAQKRFGLETHYASFSISADSARIDLTVDSSVSRKALRSLEEAANDIVADARPIASVIVPRDHLSRDRSRKPEMSDDLLNSDFLRLVMIPEGSIEVCCGVHCSSTAEVGAIKLIAFEKARRGVVSIRYLAGKKALDQCVGEGHMISNLVREFDIPYSQLERSMLELKDRADQASEELKAVRFNEAKQWLESVIDAARPSEGPQVIACARDGLDAKQLGDLARSAVAKLPDFVVVLGSADKTAHLAAAAGLQATKHLSIDLGKLVQKVSQSVLSGGGGGGPSFAQGGGRRASRLPDALENLEHDILSAMKGQAAAS